MRARFLHALTVISLVALVGCSVSPPPPPTSTAAPTHSPEPTPVAAAPTSTPTATTAPTSTPLPTALPPTATATVTPTPPPADPFDLVSQESLLAYLEDLTAIQPYSGWRNSASQGEAEALETVAARLGGLEHLKGLGLELERQKFRVFLSAELWETRVYLTLNGQESEVPADGLRGPRDEIAQALRFDSDGQLNDSRRDPVAVTGPAVLIRSADEISSLAPADLQGKVVFLDFAVIDRVVVGRNEALDRASDLLTRGPAGLVLVTSFSNRPGESHGSFVGDVSVLNLVTAKPAPPTLYIRLEDLAPAGIAGWDDLARVEAARLTWDADVFSPGDSGNLVARIPGADPSRAMILGAHIDSPNAPGAMDDGSGSVVLLEVARVLDAARVQPPVDLYLVWFGSEELGLYGSYHFVSTHQDLLDRAVAMLNVDCLTHPLDGIDAELNLVTWSYGRLGGGRMPWPNYLAGKAFGQGVDTRPRNYYGVESDSTAFAGFDVPHANLIYMNGPGMEAAGGVHHAGNLHNPYDTVDLARKQAHVLEQMARTALIAALETGRDDPALRVTPKPDRRAVFVASHTESVHMSPTTFTDLGMVLAMEGYDVDLVPYGRAVTPADLADADLVVALPVVDYPSPDGDPALYDEAWSPDEVAALEAYVAQGGLLVLANSASRLKYHNRVLDPNEDWEDVNTLAARFGITYRGGTLSGSRAQSEGQSPLMEGVTDLTLIGDNGVPFDLTGGQVLARAGGELAAALVDHGSAGGQVLILADVGMLGAVGEPANLPFWRNLARSR